MDRFRCYLALLFVCAFAEIGHSNERPTPEPYAIIQNAIKARGGKKAVAKLLSFRLHTRGVIYSGERDAPISITLLYRSDPISCKLTSEIKSPDGLIKETSAFNGKTVWQNQNGKTRAGNDMELLEARVSAYNIYATHLLPLLDKKQFKLSTLPMIKKEKGKDAVGVCVSSQDYHDLYFYFDKKTWLLVKREFKGLTKSQGDKLYEEYYEDYKKLEGGITLFTKKTVFVNGKKRFKLEVVDMAPIPEIKDDEFAKP